MAFPVWIAMFDLPSPGFLLTVVVNLAAGLVIGWMLARGRSTRWPGRSFDTTSAKVCELASALSARVDRQVQRIQELRRDLTRLELANDRQLGAMLRTLEQTIRPLEDELVIAARQLRREAGQRGFPLLQVRQTTADLAGSVDTHHARIELLVDEVLGHVGKEKKRLVEIVRALEHGVRTLDKLLASANQDLTVLAKESPSQHAPESHERARQPTSSSAAPHSADTDDASTIEAGNGSSQPDADADLQKIRALTRHVADQQASVRSDHRTDRRWNLAIPVMAIPLDDSHQPVGEPASMITRDISTGGISLLHTQPIPTQFLLVKLDAPILQSTELIVRILRTRTIGVYTEIAGEFVARFDANQTDSGQRSAVSGQR